MPPLPLLPLVPLLLLLSSLPPITPLPSPLPSLPLSPHHNILLPLQCEGKVREGKFKIQFGGAGVLVHRDRQHCDICLDQGCNLILGVKKQVKTIHLQPNQNGVDDDSDQIDGIIGFKENGDFVNAVKEVLGIQHVKFWFKIYENVIEIIPQSCHQSIFPPYQLELETSSTTMTAKIHTLSLDLKLHKSMLSLLGKQSNPFTITPEELRSKISVQFMNQVQNIPISISLSPHCSLMGTSVSSQCTLPSTGEEDAGRLVFQFDPIICGGVQAIELAQQGHLDSKEYYTGHILLLLCQVIVLGVFLNRQKIVSKLRKFNGEKTF